MRYLALLLLAALRPVSVTPVTFTEPVSADADDPAVWINPKDPAKSLIFGTDKIKAPRGGIYAFNLEGKVVQHIDGIDRPNNGDVEYSLDGKLDIYVATERLQHRLRVFAIDRESGKLTDVSGDTRVFAKDEGKASEPMGIALYKKAGFVYAIVSRSSGPTEGYLGQYLLSLNKNGKVDAKLVRQFGKFSGKKEIESIAVDDELGFVYYSDETFGTRKYSADPTAPDKELALFNTEGFQGDQEGIALYDAGHGKGFLVCTDQISGNSIYHVYDRVTNKPLGTFTGNVDDTDGIEIVSANLGPKFPAGAMIAMNSGPKNFAIFSWQAIADALKLN